jgi:hypothetical protein
VHGLGTPREGVVHGPPRRGPRSPGSACSAHMAAARTVAG